MIAFGLLSFRRCCALRLEGKSQVGILPSCVSCEGRIMPCCTILSRLPSEKSGLLFQPHCFNQAWLIADRNNHSS
jgi:hypothetical protein